ncbi:hypothetical protein Back2_08160 [Nocardioides baekrokdamisoli]|uniref:Arabinofuranosyltransferase AftA N-terminal domain-containing protein n=1 Tax=Nocardioides baekrokdamisoli TaxID=1804624 RepID=A0A3G9J0N9_9ACTN|nr:DUF6541 family protein [Nocardioides baekrokdamisoli]BBH16529.1 hypothetical protein Back2_08160 [Nocardioides baekrokdamisoli]
MTWFDFWLAFLAAAALMIAPGVALLSPVGLSWGNRIVFAPVASAAAVAVLGIAYGVVGLHFNPLTFLLGVAVIVAVAYGARRLWLRPLLPAQGPAWGRWEWFALAGGLLIGGASWLVQYVHYLVIPNAVSKTYDAPWHLSIIRHILDTGNASTLKAGIVDPTVGSYFYPASWHGLVALTAQGTTAAVPTAVNATVLAVMAVAWPLSLVAMTRTVLRANASTTFVTLVLSGAFVAFPARFETYGILYANQYGYALLPALIAAGVLLLRTDTTMLARLLLLGTALVGTAIAQPNGIFTAALLLLPLAIGVVHTWARQRNEGNALRAVAITTGFVVLVGVVWVGIEATSFMHRTVSVDWSPVGSLGLAIKDVLRQSTMHLAPAYLVAALVLAGLVVAWFKVRWLVGAYVLACGCYIVTASFFFASHLSLFRKAATGYWYHDSYRLSATIVLVAIPLAVLAITCLGDVIARFAKDRAPARLLASGAAIIGVLVMVGALASPAVHQNEQSLQKVSPMQPAKTRGWLTWAVNQPKVDFMTRVKAIVGPDMVANDPFDGSAYGYGLVGLNTFYKSYIGNWMGTPSPDQDLIRNDLSSLTPDVCAALQREHIQYVMIMGRTGRDIFGVNFDTRINGQRPGWGGVNVVGFNGFTPVINEPLYRLYKITGC